jgi:hypothetical protein
MKGKADHLANEKWVVALGEEVIVADGCSRRAKKER